MVKLATLIKLSGRSWKYLLWIRAYNLVTQQNLIACSNIQFTKVMKARRTGTVSAKTFLPCSVIMSAKRGRMDSLKSVCWSKTLSYSHLQCICWILCSEKKYSNCMTHPTKNISKFVASLRFLWTDLTLFLKIDVSTQHKFNGLVWQLLQELAWCWKSWKTSECAFDTFRPVWQCFTEPRKTSTAAA